MQIDLVAGVSVSLPIKTLFFTIHLSFEATIRQHFTLGSVQPTPWILKPPSQVNALAARSLMAARTPQISFSEFMATASIAVETTQTSFTWSALAVWKTPQNIDLFFQPSFTVGAASDEVNDPAKAGNTDDVAGVIAGLSVVLQPAGFSLYS